MKWISGRAKRQCDRTLGERLADGGRLWQAGPGLPRGGAGRGRRGSLHQGAACRGAWTRVILG
jgi:hypothetical protein